MTKKKNTLDKKPPTKPKHTSKTDPLSIRILRVMRDAGRPLFLREINKAANLNREERHESASALEALINKGLVLQIKGKRYGLSDLMHLVTGNISVHPDGFGFVTPEQTGGPDIFIPPKALKGAIHGDRVVVRIEQTRGRRQEGSVIRILERRTKRIVGTFHKGKDIAIVVPEDERLAFEVAIPKKATLKAKNGDVVVAEIVNYLPEGRSPEGRVIEILGDPNDLGVQARIVINKYELPHEFSDDVVRQAAELPKIISQEDISDRKDLRAIPLITIDGENARDFDDAVFAKKTKTGYVIIVAIADVGHYVKEGSPIDEAARERGTSVYFPNAVVPMLPETLSNHLCSLVPGEDRLVLAIELNLDRQGNLRRVVFSKAVIKSHRRLTYTEATSLLGCKTSDIAEEDRWLAKMLKLMKELALILNAKRVERGSIDFDMPEPEIILGLQGNLEDIVRRERNIAHRIIEEFMLAANEAVAAHLAKNDVPTLYRVHPEPDRLRLNDFVSFARGIGLDIALPDEMSPRWCQEVLLKAAGSPIEYIINTLLLRSMQQAVYSPINIGHFGLASTHYLHFTSPIRRYPDLIVHRILTANMGRRKKTPLYTEEVLSDLGRHCSQKERTAMEAEREMIDRLKVRLMADKIGEVYEGVISGVASFGFFVELKDVFIEGAVRLVDLTDDYYVFDQAGYRLVGQRHKRTFQIGDIVKVRVKEVNVARRHINFEVIEERPASSRASNCNKTVVGG
ncbi:ribonuclease R [Dissulfurimicrobium hydrothermale]|uniref:ribonuclease R n=1 Tax=Dissulfurimicrobium hydrothermale TaxID=1750598 RepID=UPI001EDC0D50|nr:ribonuclease R [Dissulfurimicrobium hydrothermale]UKL13676.1 ribonuclease R [Dissulfurimicrobium hydrothermale]